jgi:hypothetical protein
MAYTRLRAAAIVTGMSIVSGAIAGTLVALLVDFSFGGPHNHLDVELCEFGAMVGGAYGAVLGPAAAFGFLRRVPVGRLFGQTILGAVIGALLGLGIGEGLHLFDGFFGIFGGGILGFCAAATRLWWRSREGVKRSLGTPAGEER